MLMFMKGYEIASFFDRYVSLPNFTVLSMARLRLEFPLLELGFIKMQTEIRNTIDDTNFREEVVSKSSNSLTRLSQSL